MGSGQILTLRNDPTCKSAPPVSIKYKLNGDGIGIASVTIVAGFCPEFNPPFLWRSKHQTRNECSYE